MDVLSRNVCYCGMFSVLNVFLSPFMLTCCMMRFISLLVLGLCACVVFVVLWLSLVCM